MSNKKPSMPKDFYTKIAVAPEDIERFKKGCAYYGMICFKRRGDIDFTLGFNDASDLYWLGANMFGKIEMSSLCKKTF